MDGRRVFRHCFKTFVGRKSRTHVESDEDRIAVLTSASEARSNLDKVGTELGEREWGSAFPVGSREFRRHILSLKKERKEEASADGPEWAGREEVLVLWSRELRPDQS